jgi:hypothetical protein
MVRGSSPLWVNDGSSPSGGDFESGMMNDALIPEQYCGDMPILTENVVIRTVTFYDFQHPDFPERYPLVHQYFQEIRMPEFIPAHPPCPSMVHDSDGKLKSITLTNSTAKFHMDDNGNISKIEFPTDRPGGVLTVTANDATSMTAENLPKVAE